MLSIQKCFDKSAPKLLTPGREFIKEGILKKVKFAIWSTLFKWQIFFFLIFNFLLTLVSPAMPEEFSFIEYIKWLWLTNHFHVILVFLCSRYHSTCTSAYCIWILQISKRGGKPHDRMFFMFSDILLYGKPRLLDSTNNSYTCCCVLPLKHCQLETVFGGSKRGAQENTEAGGMFKVCVGHSVRRLILRISAQRSITSKGAQKNTEAFCL